MNGHSSGTPDYSILSQIHPIESPPKTSLLYQLNLLLVAIAMILLPLIYFALVGLAAYGLYYHATEHHSWITGIGSRNGRLALGAVILYLIPLFVGAVVVFFMIKPIFAGRPKRAQPLALNPAANPLLYAFIEKICETVGAPSPKRIDLNCDLNASAGFRRGFFSMFGNDLVLTIGLPLVANLSAAEFAGVVAHEFGHFTQSLGMRLCYIIRSVNFWFMRVVYERDAWDEALEDWANEIEDGRVAIIVWAAQIGVWFARLILRILMYIGWLIGGFMMRQMEYDADAWEIKLAGSGTFERTQRKLATLSAAMEKMYKQIHMQWEKTRQLPDNLSELLRQAHDSLPSERLRMIEDASGLEKTGWFDSHPSLADRIRAARRAQEPGVFHEERPAASLFSSFEHPARFVTLLHYTDDLDIPVTEPMLLRVHSATASTAQPPAPTIATITNQFAALDRYFLGIAPLLLPWKIALPGPATNTSADPTELLQIVASIQDVQGQLAHIAAQYQETTERLLKAQAAIQLLKTGTRIQPAAFGLSEATLPTALATEAEARLERDSLRHSVHEVGAALQRRLQLGVALRLASQEEVEESGWSATEVRASVAAANHAAEQFTARQELAHELDVLERITAVRETEGETRELERAWVAQSEIVTLLHARSTPVAPASTQPPQLKLTKSKSAEFEKMQMLYRETKRWLADYQANLNNLVEVVERAENLPT